MHDLTDVRSAFPILSQKVHGHQLVYLDNGATTQLPKTVLEAVTEQYQLYQANIHRGIHYLSELSTARVEQVRKTAADFICAAEPEEVIFTGGATHSINLAARAFSDSILKSGDVVVTTEMEHHSNLIPWQEACRRTGAELRVVHVTDRGELDMTELAQYLEKKPKLVAVTLVSNVLGTVNPVKKIIYMAHEAGAAVLLDAAQAMRHSRVDVQTLDCDFLCFSGHKMMAPTGIGVLYGKRAWLERLKPVMFGGGMVDEVTCETASYGALPFKFEAGTLNIAGIIGLGAALEYMHALGLDKIYEAEDRLIAYAEEKLGEREYLQILGKPSVRSGAISFNMKGLHYYDTAKLLDQLGIAVRSGHHCAQPLLARFGLEGAVRVTPAFYNTGEEIDALCAALDRIAALPVVKR